MTGGMYVQLPYLMIDYTRKWIGKIFRHRHVMLLSLHPNIIVHVENVVSLFSSPSTSSQKVRKCGSHNVLSQVI